MAKRRWFPAAVLIMTGAAAAAQLRSSPAGIRPARTGRGVSILPGGRVIAPLGGQYLIGPDPAALAISASGKTVLTANLGSERPSLSVIEYDKSWSVRHLPTQVPVPDDEESDERWHSVGGGIAFSGEHAAFVSEGNTGRIALIDLDYGERRRVISAGPAGTSIGEMVLDAARNILYAAVPGRSMVLAIDTRSRQILASVGMDGVPVNLALSPDRRKLYVACVRNLLQRREITRAGVAVVDVGEPRGARVETVIHADSWSDSGLSGIAAVENRVFIADSGDDSVTMIDARTNRIEAVIPIRIPGLEDLRGVMPMGLAYDPGTGWLLVAEAGINAVAVIDTRSRNVLGHLPAGWFPVRVLVDRGTVYVQNRKGQGAGPDPRGSRGAPGSVSIFPVPAADALPALTRSAMEADGFVKRPFVEHSLPADIRHVVLIVKESRSFDEVLGDVTHAANGPVMSAPQLARFGSNGYADGERKRLSLHHIDVTPNQHGMTARWTFSDNFYAASETNEQGLHWLSEWVHLARHGVSFAQFGEPFEPTLADTERARRVIDEIGKRYGDSDLPQVVLIHLPNDRMAPPKPEAGFPYAESYVADNDVALGRILEYLSHTKWWSQMAVFVTEASAEGGIDHIDAHRTLLLCAGPWAPKNRVSHTNTSFPGLLRTIFRLTGVPPLGLSDAAAADLSDCFSETPDPAPYRAVEVDPRLYRPLRN